MINVPRYYMCMHMCVDTCIYVCIYVCDFYPIFRKKISLMLFVSSKAV